MTRNLSAKLIAVLAAGSLALAGCSSDKAEDKADNASSSVSSAASDASSSASESAMDKEDNDKKATLSDWDGSYRSITSWLDDPSVTEKLAEHAKEKGTTVEAEKAEISKNFDTGFQGIVFNDDKITFVKDAATLDNPTETPVEYKFLESKDDSYNGHDFTWYVFEAQGPSEYKYVVLLPKHGEETLEHFHGRFGNDKDTLLQQKNFPIFVDPSKVTPEQVVEEILEHEK